jgi:K+-transporting ATPase KdpF subunit
MKIIAAAIGLVAAGLLGYLIYVLFRSDRI